MGKKLFHDLLLFHILVSYSLSQNIEESSLSSTVGPCWWSILYIVECTCEYISYTDNKYTYILSYIEAILLVASGNIEFYWTWTAFEWGTWGRTEKQQLRIKGSWSQAAARTSPCCTVVTGPQLQGCATPLVNTSWSGDKNEPWGFGLSHLRGGRGRPGGQSAWVRRVDPRLLGAASMWQRLLLTATLLLAPLTGRHLTPLQILLNICLLFIYSQ